ncbi:MAG: asparagine synthase (glutamine-hydrolyzing) [Bacteroidetes bacterium]|nr:asparagine synthase (glutamine-hydrolyzing) [Bacteroidota bacterium]
MCGITGSFNCSEGIDTGRLFEATEMIHYRGPDDFGYMLVESDFNFTEINRSNYTGIPPNKDYSGGFGFRRLSIQDLTENGHQPMCDKSRNYWIEFNGEVYNFIEIREELIAKGYKFNSGCDTEVVLNSFIEWGDECVSKFQGMWSFAILDKGRKRLFCSVDRFGIKPFYYFFNGIEFHFGSEIKQVLKLIRRRSSFNYKVLFDYLVAESYGNETEETFFTGIKKLLPGHNLVINLANAHYDIHFNKYWELKVNHEVHNLTDEEYIKDRIRELFFNSLRMRLRSDVEVGTCLSGGIDSSSIVCALDKISNSGTKQSLFTILSGEGRLNEYPHAKTIAEKVNGRHFTKTIGTKDLKEDIKKLIWHNDEPLLKASMYGGFYAYKLASENGIKVILDGQGIDEYAGGYFIPPYNELLNYLKRSGKKEILKDQKRHIRENEGISAASMRYSTMKYVFKKNLHNMFDSRFRVKLKKSVGEWFDKDFVYNNLHKSQLYGKYDLEDPYLHEDDVKSKSYKLLKFLNLPGILRQVDRNSMAFSVEARVPFLDHQLVEFVYSLPSEFIIKRNTTKYAFRESMRGIVPDSILDRTDKIGFYIDEYSLLKEMKDLIYGYVESISEDNGIYNRNFVLNNLDKLLEKRENYDSKLWRYMNGIIWENLFNVI